MNAAATDVALLALRLNLGAVFFAHGSQKLFGWFGGGGLAGASAVAAMAGFQPAELWGLVLGLTEFFGGLAVLAGALTRLASGFLAFVMAIAIVKMHLPMGYFASKGGIELPLTLFSICLALAAAGPGRLSVDRWAWQRFKRGRDPGAEPPLIPPI